MPPRPPRRGWGDSRLRSGERRQAGAGAFPAPPRAAALVFALLVLATVAAFAWAQRVKRDPLVLDRVTFVAVPNPHPRQPVHSFTPNGDCRFDLMRIRFRTTQSDHGTVQVVKPGGRVVITLARDAFLKRYTFHTFYWDGRTRNDGTAPPGRYKLRVKLLGQERTLVTPGAIKLHRGPRRRETRHGSGRTFRFCASAPGKQPSRGSTGAPTKGGAP